jgi:hypothetical protein
LLFLTSTFFVRSRFLANLCESLWPLCHHKQHLADLDLVALLPVCLSGLTTFAKSNELLSYQAMDMVFLLLQRRFSTLRPLKGYCIQSPKSRDDTATLLLVACPDRVPWSRSNLVDFFNRGFSHFCTLVDKFARSVSRQLPLNLLDWSIRHRAHARCGHGPL